MARQERTHDQRPEVITPLDSLVLSSSRPPSSESIPVAWQLLRSRLTSANNGETLISCDWARRTAATKATNGIAWRGGEERGGGLGWDDPLSFSPRRVLPRTNPPSFKHSNSLYSGRKTTEREREREREREGGVF